MLLFLLILVGLVSAKEKSGDGEAGCQAAVQQIYRTYGTQDKKLEKCRDLIRRGHRGFVLFANHSPLKGVSSKCKCSDSMFNFQTFRAIPERRDF